MARNGIQYPDVQEAIDTLLVRGDTPSVQRIREVLGTGSFTTISEHLRHWRSERELNRDVPPPKGVPEVIVELATGMWREAQQTANDTLAHYRQDANQQVEKAQRQAQEASRQAADAEQRERALVEHLRHTEQRLEALSSELAQSETQRRQEQTEAEADKRKLAALAQQRDEALQKLEYQAEQHHQIQTVQQQEYQQRLEQEEKRHEAAEARLMGLLDTTRQEQLSAQKSFQARYQQLEKRASSLQAVLSQQQAQQQVAINEEQTQHREARLALARQEEKHGALMRENQQLITQLESQACELDAREKRLTAIEERWEAKLWHSLEGLQARMEERILEKSTGEKNSDEENGPENKLT
ncbi:hypothetical protein GPM19_08190 [Halomonas sp. ZH2S]|uniref:KfrA N-terminal DNA-binding domain-containing protein n=1 Tax=Vreelandella zhuhanensis TaxID=2684210 RepID=A0A7X3KQ68_9GAMM|nr:DNA-binding protein [Halomonas zhuhanensis]MWJ28184.1 hypothetical protein [Halomonas zhuhanensis]